MDTAIRYRVNAARVAIENQTGFFRRQFANVASEWKEDDTRVTFADFAISEKIFAELRRTFPQDDFCSEESNPLDEVVPLEARYAWVLDPIDGTNNYAIGIPFCAISLALLKGGEPVYGLVFDYGADTFWEGGPGFGIRFGHRKWTPRVHEFTEREGVVATHFPMPSAEYERLRPLLTVYRMRSFGSATLNLTYAAAGIIDGCIDFRVRVWDIAAAYALLRAADKQCRFLGDPVFPMREFRADAPNVPFYAGSDSYLRYVDALYGRAPAPLLAR